MNAAVMHGLTALVTGASSGFGREIVREIVERGGNVAAAARNTSQLSDLVARAPDRVLPLPLDVSESGQIAAAIAAAEQRFGAIDFLINNAGYGFLSTIEEAEDAQIRDQFEVNLFGPIALMRAALPTMRARRRGMIVSISSTAGARGIAGSGYYCASKAALEAITESLAREAETLGIRAMIVAPGPFRTDFFGRSLKLPANEIADYSDVATQRRMYAASQGQQRGDPVRAARIIVDTMLSDNPPLRLPLGAMAYQNAARSYRDKLDDLARSEAIAPTADFPENDRS